VVLSGGSAFGLAAADGVVRWLEGRGSGFPTGAGPVPIVVAMSLFDLLVGDGRVRPGPDEGWSAADGADDGPVALGAVGAGTGATTGKWRGREHARPSGLGGAVVVDGDLVVASLYAVNAFGEVGDGPGVSPTFRPLEHAFGNTTIGVVVTNAALAKSSCHLVAQGGHDGMARAISPAHTRVDGDAVVAVATGSLAREVPVDLVRHLAVAATEQAIRSAAP
jgi:L-aminopeptidase/D-esterase-like protein